MKVEQWPIERLKPYEKNPRKISEAAIEKVAQSIAAFGFRVPIVVDEDGVILTGHTRKKAAEKLGMLVVPVHVATGLTPDQARAFRIADNRTNEEAEWDEDLLRLELTDLEVAGIDLQLTIFDEAELLKLRGLRVADELDDEIEEVDGQVASKRGEIYQLGPHQLMCGDSTDHNDVFRLLDGCDPAPLLHADPPYGMGKEADGVENDNLYRAKLDAFQKSWWETWKPELVENGSAYIWGQPEDLWRFWFGALSQSGPMDLRNEIVWDKESGMGMNSSEHRQFATATERCLFLMLGVQRIGNVNQQDFWEGFEPIRSFLAGECERMGWGPKEIRNFCGVAMYSHWFTRSQWCMIPERHYLTLASAANGLAFTKKYLEVRRLYDGAMAGGGRSAREEFYAARSFFDNEHDNMTDVWRFPRVKGEERFGHATPKPVAMIARAIRSSCPVGGLVLEPFAGTGTTLMAAEISGRVCRTMEISEKYADVTRRRWTKYAIANQIEVGSGGLE